MTFTRSTSTETGSFTKLNQSSPPHGRGIFKVSIGHPIPHFSFVLRSSPSLRSVTAIAVLLSVWEHGRPQRAADASADCSKSPLFRFATMIASSSRTPFRRESNHLSFVSSPLSLELASQYLMILPSLAMSPDIIFLAPALRTLCLQIRFVST